MAIDRHEGAEAPHAEGVDGVLKHEAFQVLSSQIHSDSELKRNLTALATLHNTRLTLLADSVHALIASNVAGEISTLIPQFNAQHFPTAESLRDELENHPELRRSISDMLLSLAPGTLQPEITINFPKPDGKTIVKEFQSDGTYKTR